MKRLLLLFLFFALPATKTTPAQAQTVMLRDPAIAGAVAGIETENLRCTVADLVSLHNRNNLSAVADSPSADPARGIGSAADYLYKRVSEFIPASHGRLAIEKVFYRVGGGGQRLPREVELCNVVATVKGIDPADDRIVAVLAHYDNRGGDPLDATSFVPGANDNGSGVACMVELARAISKMDLRATVKLIFLSGEEHGLYGAKYMAELARREGWNITAVLNNDMIGNSNAGETDTHDNTVLRVFSENIPAAETPAQRAARIYNSSENDSSSRQVARYIKETGERYVDNMTVKLVYRSDRFGRGGDHTPFNQAGFPSVRLCEVHENYFRTHQDVGERDGIEYGDVIGGIDFEYLRKNTGVNLASVVNLALAPAAPEEVTLDASRLENTTRLTWQAPLQGATPAGYYVLVRETDQPQWERKILVGGGGDAREVRLPYSKDNYFFAVQSVDAGGHESLPVFAMSHR